MDLKNLDFNKLTIGQAKAIAALVAETDLSCSDACADQTVPSHLEHKPRPIIVCTDKRGVVFGYCSNVNARPIVLTQARMCLYWDKTVGGVFGLAEKGPTKDSNISATLSEITLEGVTAIMSVDSAAEKAWTSAKVAGR